jgi:hypothetical protein
MRDLTLHENIGSAMLMIGLLAYFSLVIVYGLWKPYIKKVSVPQAEFAKVARLIWLFSFAAGAGLIILVLGSSESTDWFGRIFSVILCLGIYPVLLAGTFIHGMKRSGFVRTRPRERKRDD